MSDLEDWQDSASGQTCPVCGSVVEVGLWFDDDPANGGACIGNLYRCKSDDCSWTDRR